MSFKKIASRPAKKSGGEKRSFFDRPSRDIPTAGQEAFIKLFAFFFLGFLYLNADLLADLLDVLKDFSRPCACGFVAALEFFIFGFQQFDFLGQFLKTHSGTPF
jgi:hypothetical protein